VPESFLSPLPPANRAAWSYQGAAMLGVSAPLPSVCQQIIAIATTCTDGGMAAVKIAAVIGEAFQVDGCLLVPAMSTTHLQVGCWINGQSALLERPESTFFPGLEGWLASSEPVVIPDTTVVCLESTLRHQHLADLWQWVADSDAQPNRVCSLLGIVTHAQGRINGMISLMRSHPHHWTDSEIEGLKMMTHAVAISLSHLQIQQQVSRQSRYQSVVNQLTLAIRNASELHDILDLAVSGTANALGVQRGLLLRLKYCDPLFRTRSQTATPQVRVSLACEWKSSFAFRDPCQNPPGSETFWLSNSRICSQAFGQAPHPLTRSGQELSPMEAAAIPEPDLLNFDRLPALLMVRLESQGTILGFMLFQHDRPRVWQSEDLQLVELVSAQVSTAIIQTESLKQVQSLVEKRTAELRESLSIQAKLYERTRQQIDQLRHLNQLKDEFLSTISHELRTPLTSMTMAIRMLRHVGSVDQRGVRYLDILEQQCLQETNLINDLLALQELETKQVSIQLQEIELQALLRDLTSTFEQRWAGSGLQLVLEMPRHAVTVTSDRDSLNRILQELLTNAGKYSAPNTLVSLSLQFSPDRPGGEVLLSLQNIGAGISEMELPHIFDKFRRGQGATQNAIEGTGLGLALVKNLVQLINGDITASSHPLPDSKDYATCFTLTLPHCVGRVSA